MKKLSTPLLNEFWNIFWDIKNNYYPLSAKTHRMLNMRALTQDMSDEELNSHPYILKVKNGTLETSEKGNQYFKLGE